MINERDPDQDMLEEIEKQIEEGTEFDDLVPVTVRPLRQPRATFSVRLSPEEMHLIGTAARAQSIAVGDFIRDVAVAEARRQQEMTHDIYSRESFEDDFARMSKRFEDSIARQLRTKPQSRTGAKRTG